MGAEFLFMDDNAHPHRANIVDECLQSEDITRMDWPAYSPDLNPIEHVWDMLGRRIAARPPPPTCLPERRRALLDKWCNIPQDQIDNLILSMPRRYISDESAGHERSASERNVESLELYELCVDEYYPAEKLPLKDLLHNVLHRVKECHQYNAGPFHVLELEWTGYHSPSTSPDHYASCVFSVSRDSIGRIVPFTRTPSHPHVVIIYDQIESGFIIKHHVFANMW
ncbi:transposable element Tcb1 transposase [Trichonephila clavipes]|nr:transposable element Tcb1 transposase [Trichonephila clavipes]